MAAISLGGPSPATSDSRVTSVGAIAIERFLRPVCYQNFPAAMLPASLQDSNPLHLSRLVDGKMQAEWQPLGESLELHNDLALFNPAPVT